MEQLDALQTLDQLAPLTATKEHLPVDIINILKLLGKADNIPFNQCVQSHCRLCRQVLHESHKYSYPSFEE